MRHLHWKYLIPIVAIVSLFPLVAREYTLHVAIMALYYVIMASSWNVLTGYAGQMSFAQAAFSTFAGYVSTLLALKMAIPPALGIGIAAIATCALGFSLGIVCIKTKGIYHALTTIAFAQIFRITINIEYKITRGSLGLSSIPLFAGTLSKVPYFYAALALALLTLVVLDRVLASPIGLIFRAIKDDQVASTSIGVNVVKYRQVAFVITSLFAGIAGAFLAHYTMIVSPESATIAQMALIIAMAVSGGMGTFFGPVVGAVGLQFLAEYLREFGQMHLVLLGLIMLLVVRFVPEGIAPMLSRKARDLGVLVRLRATGSRAS